MRILLVAVVAAFVLAAPLAAQAGDAAHPWVSDKALLDETMAAVQSGGVMAVRPRADALEQALAGAPHAFELAAAGEGGTRYALTDGPANTLMSLMMAASDKSHPGQTVAVSNPYPLIAFYLGSYYDEIAKPEEAVRVLSAGLALPGSDIGVHRPNLLVERGAALGSLKRWAESLASYDEGLKISDISPTVRAYLYRGRGFALIELNRLDEAEDAYTQSLKLAPGNPHAQQELDYIAGLRKGGAPQPSDGHLTSVQPASDPAH